MWISLESLLMTLDVYVAGIWHRVFTICILECSHLANRCALHLVIVYYHLWDRWSNFDRMNISTIWFQVCHQSWFIDDGCHFGCTCAYCWTFEPWRCDNVFGKFSCSECAVFACRRLLRHLAWSNPLQKRQHIWIQFCLRLWCSTPLLQRREAQEGSMTDFGGFLCALAVSGYNTERATMPNARVICSTSSFIANCWKLSAQPVVRVRLL